MIPRFLRHSDFIGHFLHWHASVFQINENDNCNCSDHSMVWRSNPNGKWEFGTLGKCNFYLLRRSNGMSAPGFAHKNHKYQLGHRSFVCQFYSALPYNCVLCQPVAQNNQLADPPKIQAKYSMIILNSLQKYGTITSRFDIFLFEISSSVLGLDSQQKNENFVQIYHTILFVRSWKSFRSSARLLCSYRLEFLWKIYGDIHSTRRRVYSNGGPHVVVVHKIPFWSFHGHRRNCHRLHRPPENVNNEIVIDRQICCRITCVKGDLSGYTMLLLARHSKWTINRFVEFDKGTGKEQTQGLLSWNFTDKTIDDTVCTSAVSRKWLLLLAKSPPLSLSSHSHCRLQLQFRFATASTQNSHFPAIFLSQFCTLWAASCTLNAMFVGTIE